MALTDRDTAAMVAAGLRTAQEVRAAIVRVALMVVLVAAVLVMHGGLVAGPCDHVVADVGAAAQAPTGQDDAPGTPHDACCTGESCSSVAAEDGRDVLVVPALAAVQVVRDPRLWVVAAPSGLALFAGRWRVVDPVSELGVHRV